MNLATSFSEERKDLEKNSVANFPFLKITDEVFTVHRIGLVNSSYVVADVPNYDFYILAGTSPNELFSKLVVLNLNIPLGCAFDGQIEQVPENFPSDRVKIMKKDVAVNIPNVSKNTTNLKYFVMNYHDIFLKMDIRGGEYLWFLSLTNEELMHFKQIVVTFYQVNHNPTKNRATNKINCFSKLFETHHVLNVDIKEGDTITVTYFRKEDIEEEEDEEEEEEKPENKNQYVSYQKQVSKNEGLSSLDMLRQSSNESLIIELDKSVDKSFI